MMWLNGPERPTDSPEPEVKTVPMDRPIKVLTDKTSAGFWCTPAKSARMRGMPEPSDAGERKWPQLVETRHMTTHQPVQTMNPQTVSGPTASINLLRVLKNVDTQLSTRNLYA